MSTEWMNAAACRGYDLHTFFPSALDPAVPALRVCKGCPVKDECLQDALTAPFNPDGIWGGTTKRERTRLRRGETAPARTGTPALNAAKTHCKRNHPFTPENTRWWKGKRSCRECYNQRCRARRQAARDAKAVTA